jgi:hypothetical protein
MSLAQGKVEPPVEILDLTDFGHENVKSIDVKFDRSPVEVHGGLYLTMSYGNSEKEGQFDVVGVKMGVTPREKDERAAADVGLWPCISSVLEQLRRISCWC